jgi:hypothetical protein
MVQKKGSEITDSEQKIEKASSMTADYLHEPEFDDESLQCSAQATECSFTMTSCDLVIAELSTDCNALRHDLVVIVSKLSSIHGSRSYDLCRLHKHIAFLLVANW